jgi:non-specific serine/threonine protein kinase
VLVPESFLERSAVVERIGRYQVRRVIGEGGMGVVYAAHDDRLDRAVAIKVIRTDTLADQGARERFRREARAAARVSHPHICPLYEFDEDSGRPFLVMELLEGESLSARLHRGPVAVDEALALADTMLDALAALHRREVVHRDLKPANVFLTPHGLKLLDFGLAQPLTADEHTRERLTGPGLVAGTPQYMAPEQLLEGRIDERGDIFAAAAVIYEMLAGRPAFDGPTLAAVIDAVGHADPPPLQGPADLVRVDAVLRQALAKDPRTRIERADRFAALLREARSPSSAEWPQARVARALTRFLALPLRVLRPDPDTDFLAFSVPDAVSIALAQLQSVVVRSTQLGAAGADIRAVGQQLGVDVVLTGTILRAGQHVRVSAQLANASDGTIIWSEVTQAPIEDLFQLQDTLTTQIVSSLKLPLSASDRGALDRQAPANADAYALYLRANEVANDPTRWLEAQDLYERALALDPSYAPAWARLGRTRRLLAKWGGRAGLGLLPQAEAAFRRALDLDPDLSIAYDQSAYVDAELGRAARAVERLLVRARHRPNDAGILAGLVTTCRYAGLLDAARAAHDRAVAIDPRQATSVSWIPFLRGDYATAIELDRGTPAYCALLAQLFSGIAGPDEMRAAENETPHLAAQMAIRCYRLAFSNDAAGTLRQAEELRASGFDDPEGWYLYALCLARIHARDGALKMLTQAIDGGYGCHEVLTTQPFWAPFRGDAEFEALVDRSAALVADARDRFIASNGPAVLGLRDSGVTRR